MQNIGFAIWIVCALVSFVLTLPYLNATGFGFLVYPLFPFFGIYAGFSAGEWLPSLLLFGPLLLVVIFSKRRDCS